jgi:membrane-associated phospholipid phosphatase
VRSRSSPIKVGTFCASGGFLASATVSLRVDSGQHFPTDVMVDGLIGTATGVAVPLVHDYVGPAAPLEERGHRREG